MTTAREYLDRVDELMENARSAELRSDAERYILAAAQVAATAACAAATLEAAAAATGPPERFAAPAPAPLSRNARSVLCGALPPGSVTTLRGIYCEEPHGHAGIHRAVPPGYHSDDAVKW